MTPSIVHNVRDLMQRPGRRSFLLSASLAVFLLVSGTIALALPEITLLGPKRYDRLKGKPTVYTDAFAGCNSPAAQGILKVTNGDSRKTRIKSARIFVNGQKVAKESDFRKKAPAFEKTIPLQEQNILKVVLKSGHHDYFDKLSQYQRKQAEVERELARLQALKKEVSASTSTAKLEELLRGLREISKSHDDRHGHFAAITTSLDEDAENEGDDDSDDEDELDSGWVGKEREKLEHYRKELKDAARECEKARDDLDKTPKHKRSRDHDKKDEALKDITRLLKEIDHAIEGHLEELAGISEKIENIKKKGPSFLIIEVIGRNCDSTPPVISGPAPADNALLNTARPVISAQYADDAGGAGIDTATARLSVDGTDVTAASSVSLTGISYTPASNLPEGTHTIIAAVADKSNNTAGLTWHFTTDTAAPVVKITSHQNDQYVNTAGVTLAGTLDDATASVTVNGRAAAVSGNTFSLAGLALTEGRNAIAVEARDPAGNIGRDSIDLNLDTALPIVEITGPQAGAYLNTSRITVAGTVNEPVTSVLVNTIAAVVAGNSYRAEGIPLTEGLNTIVVEARDRAGNPGTGSVTITLDTAPPRADLTGAPADPTRATEATLSVGGEDVLAYRYQLDGGSYSPETDPSTAIILTALSEGTHSVSVIGKDRAGNWQPETSATTATWIVDATAPALNVSTLADGSFTNKATLNIAGTATDNVAVSGVTINGLAAPLSTDGSFSQAITLLAGSNLITIVASDQAGNTTTDERTITLDQTAPALVITAPVDNSVTNAAAVTVTGTVDETSTVSVALNGGTPAPAAVSGNAFSAELTYTYGQNTIEVTATDRAGNSSVAKRTVTFDNLGPSLAVTNPAEDITTNQASILLQGTVTDLTTPTVAITVDGTAYAPAVIDGAFQQQLSFSAEKTYIVVVAATDSAQNTATVQRNILFDATPPSVAVDPVTTPTNQASQTVSGTREAGATVNIACPSAAVGPVAYPSATTWQATLTNLTEGSNILAVTAADAAGNASSPLNPAIVLDTLAPDTVIGSGPDAVTNSTAAGFGFTSTEADATFECRLDAAAFATCVSPRSYTGLVDGGHTFLVRATDAAGNSDPTPAARTWTIDTVPPLVQITSPAAASYLTTPSLIVTGTVNEAVSSVTVNGTPATITGTGFSLPGVQLTEGVNTITVVATDLAGNPGTGAVPVTLDTVAPEIQVTSPEQGSFVTTPKITVTGSITEPHLAEVRVNGTSVPFANGGFSLADFPLTEGLNTITVTAKDLANNQTTATVTLTLDTQAPTITITTPPAGFLTKNAQVPVAGSVSEPDTTVTINTASAVVSGQSWSFGSYGLSEGQNTISATATDRAGNAGSTNVTVTLDTTPPNPPVLVPAASPTNVATTTIAGSAEAGSTITVFAARGAGASQEIGTTTADAQGTFSLANVNLQEGTNTFTAVAADAIGNASSQSNAAVVVLDTLAPVVTITAPSAGALLKTELTTVTGAVSEPVSTVLVNGIAATLSGLNFTAVITLVQGPNPITASAQDGAGNAGSAVVTVSVDSLPPAAPVISPLPTPSPTPVVTVNGTAEAGSMVTLSVQKTGQTGSVTVGTATATAQGGFSFADVLLAEGISIFTATAADAAGNTSGPSAPVSVARDTTPPVITVASPPNNSFTNQTAIAVTGTVDEPAELKINGAAVTLDNLAFTHSVTLSGSTNFIVISAKDLSGNVSTVNWVVYLDQVLPVVVITAPADGLLTRTSPVTVSGTVSETNTTVTVNGTPATVTNKSFTVANISLAEGQNTLTANATDRAGNVGTAGVNVFLDTQLPAVTVGAPAQAAAGTSIAISTGASDNRGLTLAEVSVNGVSVWSSTLNAELSAQNSLAYTISADAVVGSVLTIAARAYDSAGNIGTATAQVQVNQGPAGPGYLQGEVYDDTRGSLLPGATVSISSVSSTAQALTTLEDGTYFTETAADTYLISLSKPGFTTVDRTVTVKPEQDTVAVDARLTPVNAAQNLIDGNGGTAKADLATDGHGSTRIIELQIPANALVDQSDIRITPISNQGLAGLLPTGWSPIAVVDIRAFATEGTEITEKSFGPGTSLRIPVLTGLNLTAAGAAPLVKYDTTNHQWIVQTPGAVSSDSAFITASIPSAGQYAFVLPDSAATIAVQGSALPTLNSELITLNSSPTATGRVVPAVAPAAAGIKAVGEIILSLPSTTITSGTIINAKVTERFDLLSGEVVLPTDYVQDLVLYHYPCITNFNPQSAISNPRSVQTTFPVTPSHEYTIIDLMKGKVGVEISLSQGADGSGTMVGTEGARLLDKDGNVLVVPQNGLTKTVPVETRTVPASTLTGVVGSDFTLLRAVEVDLANQTLAGSAELSIPAPSNVSSSLPIVVAKAIEIKGVKKLKLAAFAKLSGSLVISSVTSVPSVANSLSGISVSGTYVFLQAKAQLGFATGAVKDGASKAYPSAQVTTSTCSLTDLTGPDGKYLVASTVANFTLTASDIYKNDKGQRVGTITSANQSVSLDVTINVTPPSVASVVPAEGAIGVDPKTQVVITMSEAVKPESVTSNTITLEDSVGTKVPGVFSLSPDGTLITFYPGQNLASETAYTLTIGHAVQDLQGYFMGQDFLSHFTIKDTTPPPMPHAGNITASFPDAEGYITITATQGSVEAGCTVLIINETSGEIVSFTPGTDGSFSRKIRAMLGDEIKIVMMDAAGNQTVVSYITFKSDDGKYLVTAKGGIVEGEGGLKLEIPDGALMGPTVIKITPVTQAQLPHPLPETAGFLAAVNIDTGGAQFQKPAKLSVPAPANISSIPEGSMPFVSQPSEHENADGTKEKVYVVHDSAKIVGDRLTTASPPFAGIQVGGFFVFEFPYFTVSIVDGYTYRDMDGLPGYLPGVDQPVKNAVVRSPASWEHITYSRSNGAYALFTEVIYNVGAPCRDYRITAIHPQTMNRVNANPQACEPPYNIVHGLNFKLAGPETQFPDKSKPLFFSTKLQVAPDQGPSAVITAGTVPLGTEIEVPISVVDQAMGTVTLSIAYKTAMATSIYSVPITESGSSIHAYITPENPVPIYRYSYQPDFGFPIAGSAAGRFKPNQEGTYVLTLEATDAAGNRSTKTLTVRALTPGTQADGVDGAPVVDEILPTDGAQDISAGTPVLITFNEPVSNVTNTTVRLIDTVTELDVATNVYVTVDAGKMHAIMQPKANLNYGRTYRIVVGQAITDVMTNSESMCAAQALPLPAGCLLPLDTEYRSQFTTNVPVQYGLPDNPFASGLSDIALYTSSSGSTFAYITAQDAGWGVVDVTDPTHPVVTFSEKMSAGIMSWKYRGVAVNQQTGILAQTDWVQWNYAGGSMFGNVRFYDLNEDPSKPTKVGQERLAEAYSGVPGRVATDGNYALVATAMVGLQVVDVEAAKNFNDDPGSAIVGVLDTVNSEECIQPAGSGSGNRCGSPMDVVVYKGGKALLTAASGHILLLDTSIPQPQLVTAFKPAPSDHLGYLGAWRVGAAGDYAYIDAEGNRQVIDLAITAGSYPDLKLHTLDITDPYNPEVIGVVKDSQGTVVSGVGARQFAISKAAGLIYVSAGNAVYVIDIKNPREPLLVTVITDMADSTGGMVTLGLSSALVEKDGWVYLANQSTGVKALDMEANQALTIYANNGQPVTSPVILERAYHLSQFDDPVPGLLTNAYTDSYETLKFNIQKPSDAEVKLLDRNYQVISTIVPKTALDTGDHSFLVDYSMVAQAGIDPATSPLFFIRLKITPHDGSLEQERVHPGKLYQRSDGKMLGQTLVHDVLIQDGSLNLSRQDLALKGRGPQLAFSRSYNNQASPKGFKPLGEGWSHSLDMKLRLLGTESSGSGFEPFWILTHRNIFYSPNETPPGFGAMAVVAVNGTVFKKGGNVWYAERGHHGTLTEISSQGTTTFLYTAKDGTRYSYPYPWGNEAQVKKIEDRNGNVMTFTYDPLGRLERVKDSSGRELVFFYAQLPSSIGLDFSRLMKVTGPDGVELLFTYDAKGYLSTATRGGRTEKYEYALEPGIFDADHNLVKATDANNNSYAYTYHAANEISPFLQNFIKVLKSQDVVKQVAYPGGSAAAFAYNVLATQNKRTVTDLNGKDTVYTLNHYGNPLKIEEPLGKATQMTWSIDQDLPDNVMTSRIDSRGFTTVWEYDAKGNIRRETDPFNNSITTSWNQAFSLPESRRDRNGVTQVWQYDAKGNLVLHTDGDGKQTSYTYFTTGEVKTTTDPRGNATSYTYDDYGNPDKATAADSSVTDSDYDVRGRRIAVIDPLAHKTEYTYDDLDRLILTRHPAITAYVLPAGSGRTETYTYDAVGNLLGETNRNGLSLSYTYTPRNQVKTTTRNIGGAKNYTYDGNGNLLTETDWKGVAIAHTYNDLNQRVSTRNRLGHTMAMAYDTEGNLTSVTDYEGRITTNAYDKLNRLTETVQPALDGQAAGRIANTYYNEADPKTNLKTTTDQEGNSTTYEYNGRSLPVKRTNALNGVFAWEYDDNGNIAKETDEENNATTYDYDTRNRRTAEHKGVNIVTQYQYDVNGNRTHVIDPLGKDTAIAYDEWNRPWKTTDPDQFAIKAVYDGQGNKVSETDGNGHVRSWNRDTKGRVQTAVDAEGNTTAYTYDQNDNVETVTDALGTKTKTAYDAEDRATTVTEADGTDVARTRAILSRDRMGNALEVKDFNGNITKAEYNVLNLPARVFDPAPFSSNYTETAYYRTGKIKSVRDRRGNTTTHEYDGLGREIRVAGPLSTAIETAYDKVGNVKTVKDKRGIVTENFYDSLYRLVKTERAGVQLVTNEYDNAGNKTATIDANSNRTAYAYNNRNLLVTTTYPDATTETRTHDGARNVLTETDEEGKVTTYTYDQENRKTSAELAGEKTITAYDGLGNVTLVTKPLGNGRTMEYDRFKRLVKVSEGPSGQPLVTRFEYDANGNQLHQYDSRNNDVEFAYDSLNRKTQHIQHKAAGNLTTAFSYDAEGNVTEVIDPKGQSTTYVYDALNRMTDENHAGNTSPYLAVQTVKRDYDANNNITAITETKQAAAGPSVTDTTTNTYDNFDRLVKSIERGVAIDYAYDANGNRTSVATPSGSTVYTFDNRNRIKTATAGQNVTDYIYTADGKKKSVAYPNGTEVAYDYTPANRVKTVVNSIPATSGIISSYTYTYDANGNRTAQTEVQNGAAETTTYTYDSLDRMTQYILTAGSGVTKTEYTFEGYNRKTEKVTQDITIAVNKTYQYDETDWVTSIVDDADTNNVKTISYTYDRNGNTLSKADSSQPGQDMNFIYDSLNRLVQVKQGTAGNEAILGLYDYNAEGMRVRVRNGDRGDVDYFYDDNSVIEEHNATDGSLLAHYRYADRLLSLSYSELGTPNSELVSQYYHYDALGSTVNLSTAAGAVQTSYTLDPWGHIRSQAGDSINRQIFTGQEHDYNTGLIYFGARYYDPDTGRFITQDSYLGEQGTPPSLHRYLYAYGNPTVYVDLFGYESVTTMLDNWASKTAEDGNNLKLGGIVALQAGYKLGDLVTFGWISKHDAARDKYDRGDISLGQYVGASAKAAAESGVLVGASMLTGGVAGYATRGMGLTSQLMISGAAAGLGYQAADDALRGELSDASTYAMAGLFGAGGGLATRGAIGLKNLLGEASVSEGMQILKSTIQDKAQAASRITNELKSGVQEAGQEVMAAYKKSLIGNERGSVTFSKGGTASVDRTNPWNEFQARSKGQFSSRAEAAQTWKYFKSGEYVEMAEMLDLSSPKGRAVFWSKAKIESQHYAKQINGTTLEMTPGGKIFNEWKYLEKHFDPSMWGKGGPKDEKLLWGALGESFAGRASGPARWIHGRGAKGIPDNVWNQYEKGALTRNLDVNAVREISAERMLKHFPY